MINGKLTQYSSAYLVGIKGVGMASLAECLLDAGLTVRGSDVDEEFVTDKRLNDLAIRIDKGFDQPFGAATDLVIYTGAHQASQNPQVLEAQRKSIPTLCHAQALAELFNDQSGIAVCGVGGKSSVSAMLAWALTGLQVPLSFSVGVGNISGLEKIGAYTPQATWFVAEADEYAANPTGVQSGEKLLPRFSYLKPQIIICTNLKFDHPDVYRDFDHTKQIFQQFFMNLKPNGKLIVNADDTELLELASQVKKERSDIQVVTFGQAQNADVRLVHYSSNQGVTSSQVLAKGQPLQLDLLLPGKFHVLNTLAALTCLITINQSLAKSVAILSNFKSTQRRLELVGKDNGITLYDDYAHHPHEVAAIYKTFTEWFEPSQVVVAFQPHTYSRTKALFDEFVKVLSQIPRLVLMDIFPSAREAVDRETTSSKLLEAVRLKSPHHDLTLVKDQAELFSYYQKHLKSGEVFVTLGAGDIYQVFDLILPKRS